MVFPIEGAALFSQNHIGVFGVGVEDDRGNAWFHLQEAFHQMSLFGEAFAVDHQADLDLPRHLPIAQIDMAHKALAGGFIVDGDVFPF